MRLTAKLRSNSKMELTLVDRHDYHQAVTELPRVAGGTRAADAVRIPLQDLLAERVRFVETEINGFDLDGRRLLTAAGPIGWSRLVLPSAAGPTTSPSLAWPSARCRCTRPATQESSWSASGPRYGIYVAGDLASVVDPRTGHVLPPLAQVALEEGETVARNLDAELRGRPLEAFTFHDKGFVVSVGTRRGVADIAGVISGGHLAHVLKYAIEWEYRQSVRHLRGWDPVAR